MGKHKQKYIYSVEIIKYMIPLGTLWKYFNDGNHFRILNQEKFRKNYPYMEMLDKNQKNNQYHTSNFQNVRLVNAYLRG